MATISPQTREPLSTKHMCIYKYTYGIVYVFPIFIHTCMFKYVYIYIYVCVCISVHLHKDRKKFHAGVCSYVFSLHVGATLEMLFVVGKWWKCHRGDVSETNQTIGDVLFKRLLHLDRPVVGNLLRLAAIMAVSQYFFSVSQTSHQKTIFSPFANQYKPSKGFRPKFACK